MVFCSINLQFGGENDGESVESATAVFDSTAKQKRLLPVKI